MRGFFDRVGPDVVPSLPKFGQSGRTSLDLVANLGAASAIFGRFVPMLVRVWSNVAPIWLTLAEPGRQLLKLGPLF